MILASSALVTAVIFPYLDVGGPRNALVRFFARILESPLNVFFLHVLIIAVLQATGIALALGQTSILIYFVLSLLIYGTSKNHEVAAVIGLTIILLKPQLGVMFVGALLMMGATHWARCVTRVRTIVQG